MELFVHILLACSVLVSVIAANPGHELHHGADHIHQPRQEGGAPFAGIESLSYSVNLDSNTPTFPTVTQTKRSTTQSSGSIRSTTGPTTYLPLETGSIGPFPVTQFAVAIATICSSGVSPISNATNSSASIGNTSAALSVGLYDAKMVSELPAAATTLLRLNSSETHNTSASTPTFTAFDSQGCSRLYTMTSSAICATLLKGVGALPVRVTDCEQSVTFSTSTGCGPAPTAVGLNSTTAQGASAREHLAYFVAPWHELTDGRVPSRVVVQNCVQGIEEEEEACGTVTESWRVVNQTSLLTIIGTLAFQGPVTGPATVTLGRGLFTTTVPESTTTVLSIQSNATLVVPTYAPSLSRSVIGASADPLTTTQTVVVEMVSTATSTVYDTLTRRAVEGS